MTAKPTSGKASSRPSTAAGDGEARLQAIRARIDALDGQIQQLISERARCAQEIGHFKQADAPALRGKRGANYYRPEREAEVLRKVIARNEGPLPDEEMARLFREIMSACLALEAPLTIAFLGPEGTYTHAAVRKHFGHAVRPLPQSAIADVFRDVEADNAHFGVVPIENSSEGIVSHTLDMFMQSSLHICGEIELRVHHQLLSKGKSMRAIKKIVSHQQSLAQCRAWLNANLPGVEWVPLSSNAEAARYAKKHANVAAIAGASAAELYGLNILASNIEDNPNNTTRFLVIGKRQTRATGVDKTTLLVSARNRPGVLHDLLSAFARRQVSLSRIESRPSRQALWEYVFFLDIDGHADEPRIREALDELTRDAAFLKLLGSYPKAVL